MINRKSHDIVHELAMSCKHQLYFFYIKYFCAILHTKTNIKNIEKFVVYKHDNVV